MNDRVDSAEITYRPSLVGRIARMFIPLLRALLPADAYRRVYDLLYEVYRKGLRFGCLLRLMVVRLVGDQDAVQRARLTYRLYPYSMGGRRALDNAFDLVRVVDAEGIPGGLVECGVAEGGTAAMMAMANRDVRGGRREPREKWLFDSFEGLPEPTDEDYLGTKTGTFIRPLPKGACLGTVEQVGQLMFDELGFEADEVHLIKGWFQDTVPAHRDSVGTIAVLRLDGDWYESTKIPLENFYDQIAPGGFVIVDDYGTCFGSKRATDEFMRDRDIDAELQPDGRGGAWFRKPTEG